MKRITLFIVMLLTLLPPLWGRAGGGLEPERVLCVGNSFTYFYDSYKRFAELAESQGHKLDVTATFVGGYTFGMHLTREQSLRDIFSGRYDYVFLQDQSQNPAWYAQDAKRCKSICDDLQVLTERVRTYSPQAKIWMEQTWAYPAGNWGGFGTEQDFDNLLRKGAAMMAKKAHTSVSPIGEAFAIVRKERPDINLYEPDQKHQSALGTYLKACVNYLLIYRQPFDSKATACGNDEQKAAYLRQIAEKVVLEIIK